MKRFVPVLALVSLAGCGPTFEDKLAGTWDCKPEQTVPNVDVSFVLNYKESGDIDGSMTVEESVEGETMLLRGSLNGSWTYDGETLGHRLGETFEEMSVNGEALPRDQVPPEVIANFRPEDDYEDPVDLVEDELIWYDNPERTEVGLRCSKRGAEAEAAES